MPDPREPSINISDTMAMAVAKGKIFVGLPILMNRPKTMKEIPISIMAGHDTTKMARNCIPQGSYQGSSLLIKEV
jgi:hypothetical protein